MKGTIDISGGFNVSERKSTTLRSLIVQYFWLSMCGMMVAASALGLRLVERLILPSIVHAASGYDASVISFSAPKELAPGQEANVSVTFKNIGSATWSRDGKNFVSLYQWNPTRKVEMMSPFATAAWSTEKRPAILKMARVMPGGVVDFVFPIRGPTVPGDYHADFILTAEDAAWMKHGQFSLDIKIKGGENSESRIQNPDLNSQLSILNSKTTSSSAWSAELVSQDGSEWQIDPSDHVITHFAFKNTGTKTWTRDGKNFISLYATDGTKERASLFKDFFWLSKTRAVKLKEKEVKPGEIGHFDLELRAPMAPGSYRESFTLAAENTAWIQGGTISLPIRVPYTSEFIATAAPNTETTSVPAAQALPKKDGSYVATLLLRSVKELALAGDTRQDLTFGFKNTGKVNWQSRSVRIKGVTPAVTGISSPLKDESWTSSIEPFKAQGETKVGEIGFLNFKIKVPSRKGTYQASFQLYADGQPVEGGEMDIPITVTADGVITPVTSNASQVTNNQTVLTNLLALNGDISNLPAEPIIRVGLYKTTDNQMIVRAKYVPLTVTQNGNTICRLAMGETVTVSFDRTNRIYKLNGGSCGSQSTSHYLIRADDGISPMEIADYSRPVGWLPGANDNTFRAQLELRYTPSSDNVWVINELPVEAYLKGIAETSNSSPQEYQRALLTSARTYAMYHVQRATKHANEYYIVDAHFDQVYRGYGAEARGSNIVAAVDATRGQVVTYDAKLAITPYYSRSDGRTRAWTEVWGGGPYPWLVSVPVPWDQGRTLWGHGVGLSATGALGMAADGKKYDEILKHFYQGIELRRAYK